MCNTRQRLWWEWSRTEVLDSVHEAHTSPVTDLSHTSAAGLLTQTSRFVCLVNITSATLWLLVPIWICVRRAWPVCVFTCICRPGDSVAQLWTRLPSQRCQGHRDAALSRGPHPGCLHLCRWVAALFLSWVGCSNTDACAFCVWPPDCHTHTHTHTHTNIHSTRTHTHTQTFTQPAHTRAHTHTQTNIHSTRTHTRTHTQTNIHSTRTHTRTHTHKQTFTQPAHTPIYV